MPSLAAPRPTASPVGLALLVALGLPACVGTSAPHTLARALQLAAAGDPASLALCKQLEIGQGRGLCKVEASRTQPDRGVACQEIIREQWRSECWFVYAEDLAFEKRWAEAIVACQGATQYRDDCARHLWWESGVADDPAGTALIVATFPGAATVGGATPVGVTPAEQAADLARLEQEKAERKAHGVIELSLTTDAWSEHFRNEPRIDLSSCPADARAPCEEGARRVFAQRWERTTASQPAVRAELCAGGELTRVRLQTGGHPVLEAELSRLRGELCR